MFYLGMFSLFFSGIVLIHYALLYMISTVLLTSLPVGVLFLGMWLALTAWGSTVLKEVMDS